RLGVIRLQLLVRDRPGRRETSLVLDLAEILLAEPQQHCPVDFGVATDVVVDAGMENLPILVFPTDISFVLVVDEDGAGIPVLLLAREIVTPLEQQNSFPGRSQMISKRAAPGAGADDDRVIMVCLRHAFALLKSDAFRAELDPVDGRAASDVQG